MSSIGSIGSNPLIQMLNSQYSKSKANSSTDLSGSSETSSNDQGVDALKEKMDSAIADALKKLDTSSDADTIMQTIKSAIDGVMKENGIDPDAMKDGMRPSDQDSTNMPPPPPPSQGGGGKDDFMSKIESLLQQNGFDVDKFKSEMSAKHAQHGSSSSMQLMNTLTSTQGVDEQA
jgi:hypothetical protein